MPGERGCWQRAESATGEEEGEQLERTFKIVIVGGAEVGKTALATAATGSGLTGQTCAAKRGRAPPPGHG
jgi:polynucleotide 5'-kinase involved in rRNA processing